MDITSDTILLAVLCAFLGMAGQLIRIVLKVKADNDAFLSKGQESVNADEKTIVDALTGKSGKVDYKKIAELEDKLYNSLGTPQKWELDTKPFKKSIFVVGPLIGFGVLLYELWAGKITVDAKFMALVMATGYAGSDFLEGLYDCLANVYKYNKPRTLPKENAPASEQLAAAPVQKT